MDKKAWKGPSRTQVEAVAATFAALAAELGEEAGVDMGVGSVGRSWRWLGADYRCSVHPHEISERIAG